MSNMMVKLVLLNTAYYYYCNAYTIYNITYYTYKGVTLPYNIYCYFKNEPNKEINDDWLIL